MDPFEVFAYWDSRRTAPIDIDIDLNLGSVVLCSVRSSFVDSWFGSGIRRADPTKVAAVEEMKIPETKTEVRKMLGFFSWFRDYIPDYATQAKPLTDLTTKRIPAKIPWGQTQ